MRLLALAIAALLSSSARADEATMHVSMVEGLVTVTPSGGGGAGPVEEGDPLHEGDTIVTQPGARLEIALSSGTILRIGESTRLTLGQSVPQKAFSAKLWLGNVWAKVHKLLAQETFHIETENAVAGVRGTEFRVEVVQGQDDLLRVYEGAVQVDARDGKWSHRVEPGHELRFHRERPPAGPRAFDAQSEKGHRFMEWVRARKEPFEYKNPEREHRRRRRK